MLGFYLGLLFLVAGVRVLAIWVDDGGVGYVDLRDSFASVLCFWVQVLWLSGFGFVFGFWFAEFLVCVWVCALGFGFVFIFLLWAWNFCLMGL